MRLVRAKTVDVTAYPDKGKYRTEHWQRTLPMWLLAALLLALSPEADSAEPELIATGPEHKRIRVTINDEPYRLQIMEETPLGKPPESGWPLAVITHGAEGRNSPRQIGPRLLRHWVSYFAARGYYAVAIARRGFATSDGPMANVKTTCAIPDPEGYLVEQAKDLKATIEMLRGYPTIDPESVIVIGHSAGGASALALNQQVRGLKSIINVAGGLFRYDSLENFNPDDVFAGCEDYRTALIQAVRQFAHKQTVPSLWLYSENDDFFSPDLARSMADAWNSPGPPERAASLHLLPPSPESHKDFVRSNRSAEIAKQINSFLLSLGLPAETPDHQQHLESCLREKLHPVLERYLQEPFHRALAVSGQRDWLFWSTNTVTPKASKIEALAQCKAVTGDGCKLLAWDLSIAETLCPNTQ